MKTWYNILTNPINTMQNTISPLNVHKVIRKLRWNEAERQMGDVTMGWTGNSVAVSKIFDNVYSVSYTFKSSRLGYEIKRTFLVDLVRGVSPVEKIENDYLRQFGAAAETMRTYYHRIRERGEKALYAKKYAKTGKEAVLDDSHLVDTVIAAHPTEEILKDRALLEKALATDGLTDVEKRRIRRRILLTDNGLKTRTWRAACDAKDGESFRRSSAKAEWSGRGSSTPCRLRAAPCPAAVPCPSRR